MPPVRLQIARPFKPLFMPSRYKVFYGGRGGAKSWAFAQVLLIEAIQRPIRVLCARELQVSIADSVHKLLADQIAALGLASRYEITRQSIRSVNGSEFIFKGLRHNATEIKSLEGVDICWVEEGQSVSKESWDLLIPTIRKQGSEIWISFNPGRPDDETYKRFVLEPPDDAVVVKVGYQDNPWFPETLRREMEYCRRVSPDDYRHIWEGEPSVLTEAQVFKGRYTVEPFETPSDVRFFHGADWGFANDPTALVRCFIQGDRLFVDQEAYGIGVELDETPQLFDTIDTSRKWPIKADSARPETISFMRKRGFNIAPAKKWQGSVEDGLAVLKSFAKIVVHPRCRHTAEEFSLYSYKVDKNNGDILPVLVDAWNHCIAEGTLIYTERGEVPIEQVTTQDRVLTRAGYKRVLFCGVTDTFRYCVKPSLDGHSLLCTPDHKVFVLDKGFVEAGKLKQGDMLLCVSHGQSSWSMTGTFGESIQILNGEVTRSITNGHQRTVSRYGCIGMFGNKQMVQSLPGMLSITKTAIQKTTRWITLLASHKRNTHKDILCQKNAQRCKETYLIELGRLQRLGTLLQKALQNTVKLAVKPIRILSHKKRCAGIAENCFSPAPLGTEILFAQTPASLRGDVSKGWMILSASALGAGKGSCTTSSQYPQLVAVPVQTISAGKIVARVYDISVEGQHEFFANGILVHNCIDAIRYALDGYIHGQGPLKISQQVKTKMFLDRRAKMAGF